MHKADVITIIITYGGSLVNKDFDLTLIFCVVVKGI